jgi:hypothetical protein
VDPIGTVFAAALMIAASISHSAFSDEGGVSLWLPGQYGSFAAVAPTPGWSMPLIFYNYGGSVENGGLLPRGHLLSAGLNTSFDALFIAPTYTPDRMILGARSNFSFAFAPSYNASSAAALTRISMRKSGPNSLQPWASPKISRTHQPTIRTALILTWILARRNSSRSTCSLALWDTTTNN